MKLLKELCEIHAPAGSEGKIADFILNHVKKNSRNWKCKPKVLAGKGFQDTVILIFGKPRTAVMAHIDSTGYTVRYGKELVRIGGPDGKSGTLLVGEDSKGKVEATLKVNKKGKLTYKCEREIDRGTTLTFKPDFRLRRKTVQSCYLDNRLGTWTALKLAESLENGAIVFTCWEEHGGGSAQFAARYLYEKYDLLQALILDITWITRGVRPGKGVAISLRDSGIPRRSFLNRIVKLAEKSKIPFQLEVESAGGSDGGSLQKSSYPIDWCFVGAAEDNVHSPDEKVHLDDIDSMLEMYGYLMKKL